MIRPGHPRDVLKVKFLGHCFWPKVQSLISLFILCYFSLIKTFFLYSFIKVVVWSSATPLFGASLFFIIPVSIFFFLFFFSLFFQIPSNLHKLDGSPRCGIDVNTYECCWALSLCSLSTLPCTNKREKVRIYMRGWGVVVAYGTMVFITLIQALHPWHHSCIYGPLLTLLWLRSRASTPCLSSSPFSDTNSWLHCLSLRLAHTLFSEPCSLEVGADLSLAFNFTHQSSKISHFSLLCWVFFSNYSRSMLFIMMWYFFPKVSIYLKPKVLICRPLSMNIIMIRETFHMEMNVSINLD